MAQNINIIRLPQVKERTGLSRSTIYSLIKCGQFKAPISLGARAVGWLSTDVDEFLVARIKASRGVQTSQPTMPESKAAEQNVTRSNGRGAA